MLVNKFARVSLKWYYSDSIIVEVKSHHQDCGLFGCELYGACRIDKLPHKCLLSK